MKTIAPILHSSPLRVGLTFNCRRIEDSVEKRIDCEAEYDRPSTIAALKKTLESLGHEVVELEANEKILEKLAHTSVDVVFNIAEGLRGRARESQIPALLELLDIPYSGSDPTALAVCHDKALAKKLVQQAGIRTAQFFTLTTGEEVFPTELRFPLIVKPSAEGSSKGVNASSVVENATDLRRVAQDFIHKYHQTILVEEFLPGREFTIGLLGEPTPRLLPIVEVIFTNPSDKYPIYSFLSKVEDKDVRLEVPARISKELEAELSEAAHGAFLALGCRDVARMDFRLNAEGHVYFMECNPLPGIAPNYSDLCTIATAAGISYSKLIEEILAPAIRRYHHKQNHRAETLLQETGYHEKASFCEYATTSSGSRDSDRGLPNG